MQYQASVVNGNVVTAYNIKTKERDRPMIVTNVIRYLPTTKDHNPKYRLNGFDCETEFPLNKFVVEAYAYQVIEQLGILMIDYEPNNMYDLFQ